MESLGHYVLQASNLLWTFLHEYIFMLRLGKSQYVVGSGSKSVAAVEQTVARHFAYHFRSPVFTWPLQCFRMQQSLVSMEISSGMDIQSPSFTPTFQRGRSCILVLGLAGGVEGILRRYNR